MPTFLKYNTEKRLSFAYDRFMEEDHHCLRAKFDLNNQSTDSETINKGKCKKSIVILIKPSIILGKREQRRCRWNMNTQNLTHSLQIDDYLDLLNYATRIEDEAWRQSIIEQMRTFIESPVQKQNLPARSDLWVRFDALNDELLELFKQLKEETDLKAKEYVTEQIWKLKYERVMISRQLESIVNAKNSTQ